MKAEEKTKDIQIIKKFIKGFSGSVKSEVIKSIKNKHERNVELYSEKGIAIRSYDSPIMGYLCEYRDYFPRFLNESELANSFDSIILYNIFIEESLTLIKTISKFWLPIDTLKLEGKFNAAYIQNIESLKNKFVAWRRARGDGNCYYRSVIVIFILKIFHFQNTSLQSINNFCDLICSLETFDNSEFNQSKEIIKNFCMSNRKKFQESFASKVLLYQEIENFLQREENDTHLIKVARLISCNALNQNFKIFQAFIPDNEVFVLTMKIMEMGHEAEGIELSLLPFGLQATVQQFNIFESVLINSYPDETSNNSVMIYIISKRIGHYDMLMDIKQMEEQRYNVQKAAYIIGNNS